MSDRLRNAMWQSIVDFLPIMIAMGVCSLIAGWAEDNGFSAIKYVFGVSGLGLSFYGIYVLIAGPWKAMRAKP